MYWERVILSEDSNDIEEPIELLCHICNEFGYGNEMINCPKCEEDMDEKGVAPGWIHKSCCEDEFLNDPQSCGQCCYDEFVSHAKLHFDKCVNLENLNKLTAKNGVTVFTPELKSYIITSEADKFLESYKPLNVIGDTFSDLAEELLYIKDNQKNIAACALNIFQEVIERFSVFSSYSPELFYVPSKQYLCAIYQFDDVSYGAIIPCKIIDMPEMKQKGLNITIEAKDHYNKAEKFFDVKLVPDREQLKAKVQSLSEDELIKVVLVPTLCSQGFKGVKPVSFHGPGEKGGDFHPFFKIEDFGKIVYYSGQVKAVKIHAKSAKHEGNVNELINQMDELFRTSFPSLTGNSRTKITRAFIFLSQEIAPDARDQLIFEYENRQTVTVIEIDDIVTAAIEAGIADQIVNYVDKKE